MRRRGLLTAVLAAGLLAPTAWADNPMGYQLLSDQDASTLPNNHGALGLDVARGQQISDSGMTFALMRIKALRSQSAGAAAGLRPGDQIIALNGRVFSSLNAFAAYIQSLQPGSRIMVDYMPAGGGADQAQRAAVTVGHAGQG